MVVGRPAVGGIASGIEHIDEIVLREIHGRVGQHAGFRRRFRRAQVVALLVILAVIGETLGKRDDGAHVEDEFLRPAELVVEIGQRAAGGIVEIIAGLVQQVLEMGPRESE